MALPARFERTPPAASAVRARRDTSSASAVPPRRATCVSGAAASRVRKVSTIASSQESPAPRDCSSAGTPVLERGLESCRVLARDSVPIGREAHHIDQRQRRLIRDVLRIRLSEPARRGATNRGVHLAGIVHGRLVEHPTAAPV